MRFAFLRSIFDRPSLPSQVTSTSRNAVSRLFPTLGALTGLLLLSACGRQQEATVYTVPKENPEPPVPAAPFAPFANGAGGSMAAQNLPAGALNNGAIPPAWDVPANWAEGSGSGVRIATFTVEDASGALDIAVTSFPGDVGGFLANVNRWRRQLELEPATETEAFAKAEPLTTASGPATLVALSNGSTDTLAAIHMHDGASWFFKMTGPTVLVAQESENFRNWVRSIDFAATHGH